jgi:hypothetical protein
MYSTDQYLAIFVAGMFVAGIILLIRWKRERSRTREQWNDAPRR